MFDFIELSLLLDKLMRPANHRPHSDPSCDSFKNEQFYGANGIRLIGCLCQTQILDPG